MVRVFLFFMLALFSIQSQAQQSSQWFSAAQAAGATYSFRCVTDGRTTGDSCDICPSTIVESRSFNGLLVLRGSTPWRWIDQPYSIRVKPGNVVEYWEHGVSPYNERLTIALSQTPFTTVQAMADSTFCNASTPGSYALFTASDSINDAPIFRGDTLTIVGRGLAEVTFDSLGQKYVINVDSIAGGGGGSSLWTDAGAYTYLTSTTDRAVVGSATELNTAYILQANGGFFAKGAGATSGTFSAQFHNSSGTNNAFVIRDDGKIGVGLTTPNGRFQIQGFGTTSATNAFEIRNSASDPTLYVNDEGSSNFGQNTTTFSTDHPFFPIQMNGGVINFQNNAINMFSAVGGFSGEISTLGTGLWGNVRGVNFIVKSKNTNTSSTYVGGYFSARIGSAGGRAGSLIGIKADAFTDDATGGTVGTIASYIAETWGVTSAGVTATNAYGLRVNPILNTGTITNTFGIDIGDITTGTQTNQAYSIRTTDANARQGFSGSSQFGGTGVPARTLHVVGEARISDLTTDTPTGIVGADADGDLGLLGLSGLSIVSGVLTATPGGTNYQTWRDDGVAAFARPNANFVSTSTIAMALSDDAGNTETEVTANVVTNSITNALIRQGVAKSVIGVAGNATANVADIAASAADQVLVNNAGNTAIGWGTVATGGITNSAVTYAKIQNAAANNVLLGNNNGAGTAYEEITMAALQTMAGYVDGTGVAGRHAYWTDANTLSNDADNLWDATNNRMSILNTAPGVGSNNAALNIQVGAQTGPQEMIRMSGNVNGNMIMPLTNASTFAGSNTFNQVIVGGDAAGDPFTQYTVTGFATTSVGIDNSDGNKFKISPNVSTPGFNVNNGIILTNDAVCDVGINKDAPIHPLDVGGVARAVQFRNTGNEWNNSDIVFGTGAGTGPTIGSISGGNNGWQINFNTGTSPVLDGIIFTATFPNPFGSLTYSSMEGRGVPGGINFNNERVKFVLSSENATTLVLRANGTLTASTQYAINFITFGY